MRFFLFSKLSQHNLLVCAAGTHFCVCLILLVVSMLVSMTLTRLAKEGAIKFCCCANRLCRRGAVSQAETVDEGEQHFYFY